ncbi:hypothetical protein [Leifsonia sp. NPDC080035]|uniref:Uncharacterized protein n=1 Tax=Leifsonia sp. NPDC080035 TaxID=3143936 RepID=A0AAU7G7I9_9MICO
MSRTTTARILAAALSAVLIGAAAGCTAVQSRPTTHPAVSTAGWPTAQVYHTGRTSPTLTVPAGARSLHIDFSCTYGLYSVGPSADMDRREGTCGGAQSFDFDIHSIAAGTRLIVDLVVPDGTRLAATMNFSTAPFAPDRATAKQCATLATVQEAYWNADQGHDHGDVSDAQWTERTAAAKADIERLANAAEKHPASAGLLGTVLPSIAGWLTGAGDHPGGVLHAPLGDFTAAETLAGQICTANGTAMVIHSSYGG